MAENGCPNFRGLFTTKIIKSNVKPHVKSDAQKVDYVHLPLLTGKNNGFPFLDILGYLKNTHKNPKFGRVRQVPIRELGWEFPGWDLSHFAKFGIFMGIL